MPFALRKRSLEKSRNPAKNLEILDPTNKAAKLSYLFNNEQHLFRILRCCQKDVFKSAENNSKNVSNFVPVFIAMVKCKKFSSALITVLATIDIGRS